MSFTNEKQIKFKSSNEKLAKISISNKNIFSMEASRLKHGEYEFNANGSYHEVKFSDDWSKLRDDRYRQYRREWEEIPRNRISTDFPLHLDIETTNICNLQCPMCPRTVMLANQSFSDLGFMDKVEYKKIIDEGALHGLRSIKLNYLGEPLSHPDVVWHVEYAKSRGILDVMMNTNASLLSKDLSVKLLNAGLDNLFVSFDAIDPGDFESQRTGTSIGKVIDNLYNFSILRKNIRPSCQIRVSMVMYKESKWQEQFEAMKVMWRNHVDALGFGYFIDRQEDLLSVYPEVKGFHCAQPFQRMFLKFNGNVTICCVDDKDETIVGNWRNTSLYDVWNSEPYKIIRNKHSSGAYYDMDMCRKCYLPVS